MKTNRTKALAGTVLVLLIISAATFNWASAYQDSNSNDGSKIVGTWEVQVTILDCQTGGTIRTFPSITTVNSDGTSIDSTAGIPQAGKTPGHGVWYHVGGRNFKFATKSFNFDANGNFTGWTIIRHAGNLSSGGEKRESVGTAEVYNPGGVLVFTGCSAAVSKRFE